MTFLQWNSSVGIDKLNMFLKKQKNNFFTSILPLYVFLKIFTIFLPSFTGNFRDGIFRVKAIDKVWSLVVYCGLIFLEIFNITAEHPNLAYSILLAKAWESSAIIGLLVVLLSLPYYYLKAEKVINILSAINAFDEKVKNANLINN